MGIFSGNFQAWKLHSVSDYLNALVYVVLGILFFWLIIRYMNKQRNHEKALERVARRLKRLAGQPVKLYRKVVLRLPEGEQAFDAVLADKSGIYLVRVFEWGFKIYGAPDGEIWRREDQQRKEEFPNPLIELKRGAAGIQAILQERGAGQVKVMPMVIFADNYQTPELYLGYGSFSTTYQELKQWYRKQAAVRTAQYDFDHVSSILDEFLVSENA